jgi:hypothetical protein
VRDLLKTEWEKLIPTVLGVVTGLLAVVAGAFLAVAAANTTINLSDMVDLVTLPILLATVGSAVWIHRRNIEFTKSREYLDHAIEVIEQARGVLTLPDGTIDNDRIKWVTAARLITRAEHVIDLISFDSHKKIIEAAHDYQRHQFHDLIVATVGSKGRQGLPPGFFLGADYKGLTTGQAAHDPSQTKDGGKWIPERVVAVVYRFFQYPEGYDDPLDSTTKLDSREVERLWLTGHQGVCDYGKFRDNFVRVNKKVFQVTPGRPGNSRQVSSTDIDHEMKFLGGP